MALTPGTRIGSYEIADQIGVGGMGEVYRATDTNLKRQVAIKVLPDAVASDQERLARFQREAEVLASLNHPNIAQIHGLERSDGTTALVMELVEGPTLADRIAEGPIPVDEALPIAKQIAEALEAAHGQGIIHRDLKPANVKVRPDGTVKVLDFGLAKAMEPAGAASSGQSMSPTMTTPAMTQAGLILGTAAYMSPEQAKGRPADRRSDVWAFGAVLFEMLTGQRAFGGEDISETLADVMRVEPAWGRLPDGLSPTLVVYLERCLTKDPRQRVHDIADVRLALEGAFETSTNPSGTGAQPTPSPWDRAQPWVAGACLGGLVVGVTWLVLGGAPDRPARLARTVIAPIGSETLDLGTESPDVAITPDGSRVIYRAIRAGASDLYVRPIDSLQPAGFPNLQSAWAPFTSPDGAWIGYNNQSDDSIKRVSILGGPPVPVTAVGAPALRGASWTADDRIVFGTSTSSGLWRVGIGGGEPEEITALDRDAGETNHAWPHLLPDGNALLFTVLGASAESAQIALLDLGTGERTTVLPGGTYPRYASTGHIVYGAADGLRAVGFDLDRRVVTTSAPVPVADGIITKPSGAVSFDLSADGTLVYVTGGVSLPQRTLAWVGRDGREEPLAFAPATYVTVRVSPDGRRVAMDVPDSRNGDVWVADLDRPGARFKVTTDPALDQRPLWTPDGEGIVFESDRDGPPALHTKSADGRGEAELLVTVPDAAFIYPYAWSSDGQTLVVAYSLGRSNDLGLVSMRERTFQPLLETGANEVNPAVSPDGGWIAYASDETGEYEVYVERFPDLGGRVQISEGGGASPLWARDGSELFYSGPESIMAVPIEDPDTMRPGRPVPLIEGRYFTSGLGNSRNHDVAPDGRFLMIVGADAPGDAGTSPQIVRVDNWFEELKRLVPVP